jgi:hypothetical protein
MELLGSDHPVFRGLPALDAAGHGKSAVRALVARDELGPGEAGRVLGAALVGFAESEPVIRDWAVPRVVQPADPRLMDGDRAVAGARRIAVETATAAPADEVRSATGVG